MEQQNSDVFSFFTNIQVYILSMKIEEQVELLNDCFLALSKLNKKDPEKKFNKTITKIMSTETCILNKDAIDLFDFFIDIYGIDKSNFLLKSIQRGGMENGEERQVALPQHQDVVALPQQQRDVRAEQQIIVNPPDNIAGQTANLAIALSTAGVPPDQIAGIIKGLIQNQALAIQNQAIIPNMEANDAYFVRNLQRFNIVFSYTAPGAILYYLNSMLNKVATMAISTVGSAASNTVGSLELGVRNTIPAILSAAFSTGRLFKSIIPETVYNIVKTTTVDPIRSTGASDFAGESFSGTRAEEIFSGINEGTEETLLVGCILFYIIICLILNLLGILLIQMYKSKNFGCYVKFPGLGGIGVFPTNRGGKTKKNKCKGKNNIKKNKTHKRRK